MFRKDMFDLTGLVAVVTGGSRGIGKAIAAGFVAHGATVLITGRNDESLQSASEELSTGGSEVTTCQGDVSQEDDVLRLAKSVTERYGRLDILVNNAGISPVYVPLERTALPDWYQIIDVNLSGVFLCCRLLGDLMLKHKNGSIINVSSIAGQVGIERQAAYCASKGGVEQLTRAIALDWAKQGIRANTIAYGFIETDFTAGVRGNDQIASNLLARTPIGRFGNLEEVSGAAVFLASRAASFVTGTTITVDGGWTAA